MVDSPLRVSNSQLPIPNSQLPITDKPGVELKTAMAVLRCSDCCSQSYFQAPASLAAKNSIAIKKQL